MARVRPPLSVLRSCVSGSLACASSVFLTGVDLFRLVFFERSRSHMVFFEGVANGAEASFSCKGFLRLRS